MSPKWRYTGVISLMTRPRAERDMMIKCYPGSKTPIPVWERIPGYPHHAAELEALCGTEKKKIALIILGGPSGVRWPEVVIAHGPDLIIGVNGVLRAMSGDLDYWLCMESWEKRRRPPPVWWQDSCRGLRIVSWKRYQYLEDKTGALAARRGGPFFNGGLKDWNPRIYGGGLYMHERFDRPQLFDGTWRTSVLGTVAIQALHLAAILGVTEVYTIGLDLHLGTGDHHWYDEVPISRKNKWWDERMFTTHCGLSTMWWWIDSATFLIKAREVLHKCGCEWWDESDGLLARMGMPCKP